jgi:hypothetical protein
MTRDNHLLATLDHPDQLSEAILGFCGTDVHTLNSSHILWLLQAVFQQRSQFRTAPANPSRGINSKMTMTETPISAMAGLLVPMRALLGRFAGGMIPCGRA